MGAAWQQLTMRPVPAAWLAASLGQHRPPTRLPRRYLTALVPQTGSRRQPVRDAAAAEAWRCLARGLAQSTDAADDAATMVQTRGGMAAAEAWSLRHTPEPAAAAWRAGHADGLAGGPAGQAGLRTGQGH